jgi:OOP family OmpA-OmpF porin
MKAQATSVLLFALFANSTQAQFYNDMSIGVNAGAYIYQGDLTPQQLGSFKTPSFGLGIAIKKQINYFLSARFNMAFTKLKGDESKYNSPDWRQLRNFSFTAPLKEFTALLQWNILGRNYDERGFMPYVFGGAGVSFVKIRPDYSRMDASLFGEGSDVANGLAQDIAHGTPRKTFTVPIGIGVEKFLSDRFSLSLETGYRFVFTDYLDGFSQAANPAKKDHYHSTSIGIIYKFGKKENGIGCPVIKY